MNLQKRIDIFTQLGNIFRNPDTRPESLSKAIFSASLQNPWFTIEHIEYALSAWGHVLTNEKLQAWVQKYDTSLFTPAQPRTVGIIMAGNIPLVGFHDFLSVLICGHKVLAKTSSNDSILLPAIVDILVNIDAEMQPYIEITDTQIRNFDAVIATGSNNTARYFEYYFGKYPCIIRKNRSSVAVLTGNETLEQLEALGQDIFLYFGLGCRNVSKIYIPKNYDFELLKKAFAAYAKVGEHHKYRNNYDYWKAIFIMNGIPFEDTGFVLFREETALSSPIAVVYYEAFSDIGQVQNLLATHKDSLQCIVSQSDRIPDAFPLGIAQQPELWDYADGVDTLNFLENI